MKDLTGNVFTWLTVEQIHEHGTHTSGIKYLCRCRCGKPVIALASNLRSGNTKSCGCLALLVRSESGRKHRTHGLDGRLVYKSWCHMMDRCYNPKCQSYPRYGGKGIFVCEFLRATPLNLLLLLGDRPKKRMSLHRIENEGHYTCGKCKECLKLGLPMNVKWATAKEQGRHKSNSRLLTKDGVTHCLSEWAEILGIHRSTIERRIKLGQEPLAQKH